MSNPNDNKKNNDNQHLGADRTMKMPFNAANVEVTQKIEVDYKQVIDGDNTKTRVFASNVTSKDTNVTGTLVGKSIFIRKRITDDYVKSNTILSTIGSIPPLEEDLKLQAVDYNYELKHKFSEGSQGIIRTAFDKSLKRDIVVKSLKTDKNEKNECQDENLFVSEARIMAQLDHPSIIPLYGLHCGTENKLHLAMKHIHGKTLQNYLQSIVALYEREGIDNFDEKRSITTRIEYLIKACEAVDYAHLKGVIHRDLKPENIMIGNYGEVYVMDWGLACLTKPEGASGDGNPEKIDENSQNDLVGTPCYIAPELIRGGECSPQSDIFSLGMILFEVVTLQRAVPGKTVNEVLKNIVNWNYRPFKHRFLKGSLPVDLEAIIAKAICEPPSRRYKTAGDMASDLKLFLMHEETVARPDNFFRKYVRIMLNHKLLTSVVLMGILLCLAASTIYSLYSQNVLIRTQKTREEMLTFFQSDVARKANEMEHIFFYFKTQLANLGYHTGQFLSDKTVAVPKVYDIHDFRKAATAPPDYTYSPVYEQKISLDFPVLQLGSGVKLTDEISKRIVALQSFFKHIMFNSDFILKDKTESETKNIILNRGVVLSWVYVGLKSGSILCYPGGDVYSKGYDPRKRPWYKTALTRKHDVVWSEPYKDAFSSKIIMSCTGCIFDAKNEFQGVAGMDISLSYIQKRLFNNYTTPGTKEYLLNKKGKVVLSSDFKDSDAEINRKSAELELPEFPFMREFRAAIIQKKVQFEAIRYKRKYVFGLNRIPSLGYYYVEQVSELELKKNWKKTDHKD